MAYGIMQELRDTNIMLKRGSTRLLDEVDIISSASGGSFTAAYYGLHGDGIFDTYEEVFLRKNVQKPLVDSLFDPLHWFSSKGRTERAVEYYQENIFHGATYADMMKPGSPLVLINTSDLAYGVRFSFVQEYFNFLCSDLLSFPVARAVAASSAVPIAFDPIVVKNYSGCLEQTSWLNKMIDSDDVKNNLELGILIESLASYLDKEKRKFIHFVDGGITDNIGLRAFYDILELSGGVSDYLTKTNQVTRPNKWVVIVVDASTTPVYEMDGTNKSPSMEDAVGAMSDVQLHRYSIDSIDLVKTAVNSWTDDLSTTENPLTPYFIEISFTNIKESPLKHFFNNVPTSFFLNDEQVDKIIESGRQLLRNNPVFQQLPADIKND